MCEFRGRTGWGNDAWRGHTKTGLNLSNVVARFSRPSSRSPSIWRPPRPGLGRWGLSCHLALSELSEFDCNGFRTIPNLSLALWWCSLPSSRPTLTLLWGVSRARCWTSSTTRWLGGQGSWWPPGCQREGHKVRCVLEDGCGFGKPASQG